MKIFRCEQCHNMYHTSTAVKQHMFRYHRDNEMNIYTSYELVIAYKKQVVIKNER